MVPTGTFEQCCREWYPSLYRTVLLLVRDRHLAEDVLQEALVRGYQALADLRDPDRLEPWLRRIAVREALAALRARKVWLRRQEDLAAQVPPGPANPAEEAEQSQQRRLIWEGLDRLAPQQRTAFILCSVEGRSIREVAGCMGISEGAVKRHLGRARDQLRKRLSKVFSNRGGKDA